MIRGFATLSRAADVASSLIFAGVVLGVVVSVTAGVMAVRAVETARKWVRR
jgi:hypothetical protein